MKTQRIAAALIPALFFACGGGLPEKDTAGAQDLVVCPRATTVHGIDVSEWQGGIDWGAVARSGTVFAYARVSDGFYRDRTFAQNWAGMKNAGLIRGVYQYFEPNLDPSAQADLVIQAVGGHLDAGELPPMLDMEVADPGTSAGRILWAMQTWADKIQRALGKKPVIYTGSWWWNPWTGNSGQFGSYPLADSYYAQSCPNIAAGWGNWSFWQYSSSGAVPGIGGRVDLDTFNGSLAELRAFAGGGSTPGDPCAGKYGNWCGSELGLAPNTLYRCVGGTSQVIDACASGCQVNPPGVNDVCRAAPPPPRGPCTGKLTGLWCGAQLGLDGNTLYSCNGGTGASAVSACAYGCKINPLGTNDACKPQPVPPGPCEGKGSGLYCGAALGLDGNTLFSCDGGPDATPQDSCGYGCQQNPAGIDDACKPAPGPCSGKKAGNWCGAQLGLEAGRLYSCDGGPDETPIDSCNFGCQVNEPGGDDVCSPEPDPTGACSGKAAGLWCGVQLGLDADKLYSCDGSPGPQVSDVCNFGCQVNPPGVGDACKPERIGPCSNRDSGRWCGSQLGLDTGTLYTCQGGPDAQVEETCAEGCQTMQAGTDDQCFAANCSNANDGAYCGSDTLGGNPALLYRCTNGDVTSFAACAGGCQTLPAGTDDVCR